MPKRHPRLVLAVVLTLASATWAGTWFMNRGDQASRGISSAIEESDRPVIEARIAIPRLRELLKARLAGSSSLKLDDQSLSFSPVDGSIRMMGSVNLPPQALIGTPDPTESKEVGFDLSFTPSVEFDKTSGDSLLSIQLHSLKIDSTEVLTLFPAVSSLIGTILSDDKVKGLVEGQAEGTGAANDGSVNSFLTQKNIKIDNKKHSFKFRLNLDEFRKMAGLALPQDDEAYLKGLRLWRLSPSISRSTNDTERNIDIVVGRGFPMRKVLDQMSAQIAEDQAFIKSEMAAENATLRDPAPLVATVNQLVAAQLRLILTAASGQLSVKRRAELDSFKSQMNDFIATGIAPGNAAFDADPAMQIASLDSDIHTRVAAYMDTLGREVANDQAMSQQASVLPTTDTAPIISQRISQGTLNALLRSARSVEVDGKSLFQDLAITLRPDRPGLRVSGSLRSNIKGWAGQGMDANLASALDQAAGSLLPFSLDCGVQLSPDDVFSVTLDAATITVDGGAFTFQKTEKLGHLLLGTLKTVLAQAFSAIVIDTGAPGAAGSVSLGSQLRQAGDGLQLSLDPKTSPIGRMIPSMFENLNPNFWNLRPSYSANLDRSYLDLAVGSGATSREYYAQLDVDTPDAKREFREPKDQPAFDGNPVDMEIQVSLAVMQARIQGFFDSWKASATQAAAAAVKKKESGIFFAPVTTAVEFAEKNRINLKGSADVFARKGILSTKLTFNYEFDFQPTLVEADKFAKDNGIEKTVFLNHQILDLDLVGGSLKFTDHSYVTGALVWMLKEFGKIDLSDLDFAEPGHAQHLKEMALGRYLGPMLNDPKKPGSLVLDGFHLNQYLMAFAGKDSIGLQLNPRFVSNAFEIELARTTRLPNGTAVEGLTIDTGAKVLRLRLSTHAALADIDAAEFAKIGQDATALLAPFGRASSAAPLKKLFSSGVLGRGLMASTEKNPASIKARLERMSSYYPELSRMGAKANLTASDLMGTGREAMVYASTELAIYQAVDAALAHADLLGAVTSSDYRNLKKWRDTILNGWIKPFLEIYEDHFKARNESVIAITPASDWTGSYLKDASLAQGLYQRVKAGVK